MTTNTHAPARLPRRLRPLEGRGAEGRDADGPYDFTQRAAQLLDAAGVDCPPRRRLLGTVVQGFETTLRVTLGQMLYHAEMVARGAKRAFVVSDLPFLSYQVSTSQAVRSAGRVLKRTECGAVKIEGGLRMASTIRAIVEAGIPVMGHVGLTPQSVRRLGGYKVQRDEERIVADAQAVAESGAFAIVLECVPRKIAARITSGLHDPPPSASAPGPDCDGQVIVIARLAGPLPGPQAEVRPPVCRARRDDPRGGRRVRERRPRRQVSERI